MLEHFFSAPKTLRRLRAGPSGPYIDSFAGWLIAEGYSHGAAIRYLRAAAHLGQFLLLQGMTLGDIDASTPGAFFRHFDSCRCPQSNGGHRNHHTFFGAKCYCNFLMLMEVCPRHILEHTGEPEPELVAELGHWLRKHRGSSDSTVRQYSRCVLDMVDALGDNTAEWRPRTIHDYFLAQAARSGVGTAEKLVTNMRAVLRYLSVHGLCQADLGNAVPKFAAWRLADLPRYLTAEQVDRVISACEGESARRRRDRAVVLLLARLGLRAGDIIRMRIGDIEWEAGTLRVTGKGRYQVRLPLPQEVGDAVVSYLECRPQVSNCDHLFVRGIAPFRAFSRSDVVCGLVKRAMKRAGVMTPAKGAHALRHTAATQMLRHGVPLDQIGLVLRHRGVDTTAVYAKVDVLQLRQIAQPWPELRP
jgi:integrase